MFCFTNDPLTSDFITSVVKINYYFSIDPFIQCVVWGKYLHCLNWTNMISTDTKDFCEKKWALILGQLSNSKERKKTHQIATTGSRQ